ncbi:hypothetical protein AB0G32_00495 [Streptomyces sp. NPDC023723]|uniref:hypothetical protein n=1 Tax=Streptomyces sp. NPDC023723 TaxID=3154323 RepID=UPI0033E306B5
MLKPLKAHKASMTPTILARRASFLEHRKVQESKGKIEKLRELSLPGEGKFPQFNALNASCAP